MQNKERRSAGDNGVPTNGNDQSEGATVTKCDITRCDAPASVIVTLERPRPAFPDGSHWFGRSQATYCGTHAVARPSADGFSMYGDAWMMRPLGAA